MTKVVVARYESFGTAGQAHKIKPISLDDMFERYDSGSLDPVVN